jgi:hypothetical protein
MPVAETPLTYPAEFPSSHNDIHSQLLQELIPSNGAVPDHPKLQSDGHAKKARQSLHGMTESSWDAAATAKQELDTPPHELGDAQSAWRELPMEGIEAQRDPIPSEGGYLMAGQRMRGEKESESRPSSRSSRSTAPSIFRHLSAHTTCPRDHARHYPSRVTEEQLASIVTDQATDPISRQCSAEVDFAFPGIYQEMLEQWMKEPRESQTDLTTELEGTSSASQAQARADSTPQDDEYGEPPSYFEYDQDALILESTQAPSIVADVSFLEELQPLNHSSLLFSEDLDRQHFDNGSLEVASSPNMIDEMLSHEIPSTNPTNTGTRHSFGLHMSLSSVSITQ